MQAVGKQPMALILDRIFARRLATHVYGLGAVVLGLEGLVWGDFAVVWQPAANGAAGPHTIGYAVAVLPLLAGLAMQWQRAACLGALALIVLYALAEIFLDIPGGVAHASVFVAWYGVAEHLALAAGALLAYAHCARIKSASAELLSKISRLGFGVCLIYFGLAHHFYLANTVSMVPAWLPPGQTFWAYATGLGHIAAGIAIISGIYARPAAILLTAMFIVFAVLVHVPMVMRDPHTHFNWAENAVNFALVGSAWVVAAFIPAAAKSRAELS
jgi:uncharacterized membrane protein YphA (DoxX/SURF4 family)